MFELYVSFATVASENWKITVNEYHRQKIRRRAHKNMSMMSVWDKDKRANLNNRALKSFCFSFSELAQFLSASFSLVSIFSSIEIVSFHHYPHINIIISKSDEWNGWLKKKLISDNISLHELTRFAIWAREKKRNVLSFCSVRCISPRKYDKIHWIR